MWQQVEQNWLSFKKILSKAKSAEKRGVFI